MLFLDLGAMLYLLHVLRAVRRREEAAQAISMALEKAERASEAKSNFLATMSHEIRTPLNGVLGMVQVMQGEPLLPHQVDRLQLIRRSGEVLLTLLNDVLDVSRIEADKLELEMGVVDFEDLARDAQGVFSSLARDKDLLRTVAVTPAACGLWRGDSLRIRQILYNLLSNAVKFTERGSVEGSIDVSDDGGVVLSVCDTGLGLDPTQLGLLFERFVQVDASTTRRFGGSGLGLAITRDLTHLMGGEISVTGQAGQGARFTVRLPLIRETASAAGGCAAATETADLRSLRILVAEDNETNQLMITTLLKQLGAEACIARDGAKAIERWMDEVFDLVLMDIQMPVMDGLTATRAIRALEGEQKRTRTPILALTANATTQHIAGYQEAGMDGVAVKPINIGDLIGAISLALRTGSDDEVFSGPNRTP